MRAIFCLVLLIAAGCAGPPPPAVYHDHLLDAIQAAIASKDSYWLEQYSNRAMACRQTGQLSDEQYHALEAILHRARAGDWMGAARDIAEFRGQSS